MARAPARGNLRGRHSNRSLRYAASFLGIVDLLAMVPTYLSLIVAGAQMLLVIRDLRLLRVFRVLEIARHLKEMRSLIDTIRATRARIVLFLMAVPTIVLITGAAMYVIKGRDGGFTSVPRRVSWALVTVTTVDYGDIAPRTVAGQAIAAMAMILV